MMLPPARLLAASGFLVLMSSVSPAKEPGPASQPSDGTSEAEVRATIQLEKIRQAELAYRAAGLVRRAETEEAAARDAEAADLYAAALELDPSNRRAQLGLRATRDRLGLLTERVPLIDRMAREASTRRQEILYRFNAALAAATQGIISGRPGGFQKARLDIGRARLARESEPRVFSSEDLDNLDARLRDHETALNNGIARRAAAIERARRAERARRIKSARVHDIRLEL